MQISRHWRLNLQRYRLQGVRYDNGNLSLQARPVQNQQPNRNTQAVKLEVPGKKVTIFQKGA